MLDDIWYIIKVLGSVSLVLLLIGVIILLLNAIFCIIKGIIKND